MRVLITGGAGFVGSRIAYAFKALETADVTVLDNLRRRGSELNINEFQRRGIQFFHGDIRIAEDLWELPGNFELIIEASAEPSVSAGHDGSPAYVIATNLGGTLNCLEFARRRAALFLFLSTSRVYSIAPLRAIRLVESANRFEIAQEQVLPGVSSSGISENFPTCGARSIYGATKLASELMIQEYVESYGLKALVNRCGVIAGPGQFGKVDQGIFTLWIAHHYLGLPLHYTGFAGTGRQVRDLLHPADLVNLILKQIDSADQWQGEVYNIGGGRGVSVSMKEMTDICREIVGREVPIGHIEETAHYDVPLYISDLQKASARFQWEPQKSISAIVTETTQWIRENEAALKPLFGKL
jgi:CDP-paratose 2-epimerase